MEVTVLFTDLERSTELWEQAPAAMAAALAVHDDVLGSAIAGHGGQRLKGTGDGVIAAFDRSVDAAAAAVEAQSAFADLDFQGLGKLRVRMGFHRGAVLERDGDLFGPTMNRAARLMGAAHGGQVICSDGAAAHLGSTWPTIDLGFHRLKDLLDPARIYQLVIPGLDSTFPRLRSLPPRTNLPIDRSSFLGREEALAQLADAVRTNRLVTLVGPGGVGKTRLATRLAAEASGDHPDGVWFVPLAAITDPEAVANETARILGLVADERASAVDSVAEYVSTRSMLLVVDNCEHVIDAAAELVERLLAVAPTLAVIATTREPLSVAEEVVYRVDPLPTSAGGAAVELFIDRGGDAGGRFEPDDPIVPRLCERLDGLPLAIELAASKLRTLSLGDLEQRLADRFTVLHRPRGGMRHHQTLEATIRWSYDLATPEERLLLDQLSVLSGLFSLGWAERVAPGGRVAELLDRLADRSLISVAITEQPERYYLLESIKAFAAAQLEAGDAAGAHGRLVDVALELVGQDPEPGTGAEAEWLESMNRNAPNLLQALSAATRLERFGDLAALVHGAAPAWMAGGFADEGLRWAEKALAALEMPPVELLEAAADLALALHRDKEADRYLMAVSAETPASDVVTLARIERKLVSRSVVPLNNLRVRGGNERLRAAIDLLGDPADSWPDDRVREWISLQLDVAGSAYFRFSIPDQRAVIEAIRPWLARATEHQRLDFETAERGMAYQETRYRPPEDTRWVEAEARGVTPINRAAYASALFRTGFYELLVHRVESAHDRLAEAAEISEDLGGNLRLARIYTYLTVAQRRLSLTAACRASSERGHRYALAADHPAYTSVTQANLAWCDLAEGLAADEEVFIRAAELLATRAAPYPFRWPALMPLLSIRQQRGDTIGVAAVAETLLDERLQRLPDDVEGALQRTASGDEDEALNAASDALVAATRWRLR